MSSLVYFLAELYPWWGIPLALIFAELGNHFRRSRQRARMFGCLFLSTVFFLLAVGYFVSDGREKLRPAMQEVEHQFLNK